MTHRIVILGGGTGGTVAANRLRRVFPREKAQITVIDQDDVHIYQPGLLFVPFGLENPANLVRSRAAQLHHSIDFISSAIDHVDIDDRSVTLENGTMLGYDVLIIATGSRILPGETEGLLGPDWNSRVCTFYSLEGATALAQALRDFEGGRLAVNVVDMPIKCPVAPLEFCFLADWYFQNRGIRERVDITYVTPLDSAFTRPVAAQRLGTLLEQKNVSLVTEFNTGEVQPGRLIGYDGRTQPFDLAVVVPAHGGAEYIGRSAGLGDALDFVPTDPLTLQSKATPVIFVIGDASDVAASKAGSVAHFEGEVLCENVRRVLEGDPVMTTFDGHTNCFIETGFGKALLIDFNYETEPVPGHYPAAVGLPLLKESALNHWGKLMFQWLYWHMLLPGRDMPGVGSSMPTAGKELAAAGATKER